MNCIQGLLFGLLKGNMFKTENMFEIDLIVLNESRRIQLQFATNRIKIGLLEPEITSLHWAYDVTSRHRPAAGNNIANLVILCNCFLTV